MQTRLAKDAAEGTRSMRTTVSLTRAVLVFVFFVLSKLFPNFLSAAAFPLFLCEVKTVCFDAFFFPSIFLALFQFAATASRPFCDLQRYRHLCDSSVASLQKVSLRLPQVRKRQNIENSPEVWS